MYVFAVSILYVCAYYVNAVLSTVDMPGGMREQLTLLYYEKVGDWSNLSASSMSRDIHHVTARIKGFCVQLITIGTCTVQ